MKHRASIALISLLVISAFTLLLAVAMSEANISVGYQYLNNYVNKDLYYAAESCLNESILRAESDDEFTTASITLDENTSCSATVSGEETKTINITVTSGSYEQTFQAEAAVTESGTMNNLDLSSWQEI